MPDLERRHQPSKVEQRAASGGGTELVGLAAPFYDGTPATEYELWSGVFERYMPGCFNSIAEQDVRCLFNHDASLLLGRNKSGTLALNVTNRGLEYAVQVPDTTVGKDVMTLCSRGDITGSSCGFFVREERWIVVDGKREIRELLAVDVFDVSPVTYPAYEGTDAATRSTQATGMEEARRSWQKHREEMARHEQDAMEFAKAKLELDALA